MSTTTHCNKCHKKKKEKDEGWTNIMIWSGIPPEFRDVMSRSNDFCSECKTDFFKFFVDFIKK